MPLIVTELILSALICRFKVPVVDVTFSTTGLLFMAVLTLGFELVMFRK